MTSVLTDARRGHPGLFGFAVAMAVLAPVLAVLAVVDDRLVLGVPLWLKPLKFALSFVAYSAALAWLLGQLRDRALQITGWVIVIASVVEMAIITGQAAVGNLSHFNEDDGLGAMLFSIMGATIVVLWLATLAIALRFLREPGRDPVTGTAVKLGLVVALIGMLEGFAMIQIGGHAVGVPDGGPGLPLVGWSTTGGDLRIAHFVGMHALQGLPLLAAGLAVLSRSDRLGARFDEATRLQVVWIAAAAWTGSIVLLAYQALRAQPLFAPDAVTLAAATALTLGTAAALAWALLGRRARPVPAAG
jgi:hypothetical protein